MNEIISVEARFGKDGAIHPLAFTWRGRRYGISTLGRQWDQNGERHFLVMTPEEHVFELGYQPAEQIWRLHRKPGNIGGMRAAV